MPEKHEHVPVLLAETIQALCVNHDGIYFDCTFGRGGHSESILEFLSPRGQLYVLDRDLSAVQFAKDKFSTDQRVKIFHDSFANLNKISQFHGLAQNVDGVLFDLGVSSPQLEETERGFSFNLDGPLDMRMDTSVGETAAQWLARVSPEELITVLREYGEERHAKKIARKILAEQNKGSITTTKQLAEIAIKCYPANYAGIHPATRTFQAIRIHINQELSALHNGLAAAFEMLKLNGRLVVISFHSLEDRIVKRFIRDSQKRDIPKNFPIADGDGPCLRAVGKLIRPRESEIERNSRARSARLRVAEKVLI